VRERDCALRGILALPYSLLLLQVPAAAGPFLQFLPILLIFGIFYFLLFLPMQRQKKAEQKMRADLKNGDIIITTGGIVGTVVSLNDDETLTLRVKPDNIKLQVTRAAVNALVNPESKS
jgi:preprotein translocase subunit YajC